MRKIPEFLAWAEPDPKQHFFAFQGTFDYPAHSLHESFTQTNGTDGKPRLSFASLESL